MEQMSDATITGVHHVTLTVTDVERSAQWYERVLGTSARVLREGPGWHRIRMAWPSGLIIGVTQFERTEATDVTDGTPPADDFDHRRVGLDHIGLGCPSEDAVRAWARHLDEVGAVRGPVEDVPYGWAVTARDPDGIAVEFFCPRS